MARRPKTSPIDDFVSLVALLPWWACIGAALLSYLIVSAMARPMALTGLQPGQIAPVMTHALIQGLPWSGSTGNAFWDCSGYSSCKGTRPLVEAPHLWRRESKRLITLDLCF